MPKKVWTDEERKAFGEKMKKLNAEKKAKKPEVEQPAPQVEPVQPTPQPAEQVASEVTVDDLVRQINELKARMFDSQMAAGDPQNGATVTQKGVRGTVSKYNVDPANYPDPSPRLAKEQRLAPFAFDLNYQLDYLVEVSQYETKDGIHMKEPRFKMTLSRKRYDGQGNPLLDDKGNQQAIVIRRLTFHEDDQAAIVVARENGVDVDEMGEIEFLNEMRYLRVRDWLMDIFFPKPADYSKNLKEEVIGGQLVEIISLNSTESESIPFEEINKKFRK